MPNNPNTNQELVQITNKFNELIKKGILLEEIKLENAECSFVRLSSDYVCDSCGKKTTLSRWGGRDGCQATIRYRNKNFCPDCVPVSIFNLKQSFALFAEKFDKSIYQDIIKRNNEAFVAYRKAIEGELNVARELIENKMGVLDRGYDELEKDKQGFEAEKGQLVKKVSELESAKKTLEENQKQLELKRKQLEEEKTVLKEEKGKINCDCWQCIKEKQWTEEINQQLFNDQEEKPHLVKSECANCYEYKKVDSETGLCQKCSKE